jgi:hypothetical protein
MQFFRPKLSCLLLGAILVASHALSLAQNQQPTGATASQNPSPDPGSPLAAAARDTKAQKAHAKKVFTDEDMEATAGPLPRLKMDGAENADEIVRAIAAFKATHTPPQTESAVHIWYDRYDEMLAAAIKENLEMKALRDANYSNGYELCQQSQDYRQCQNRQMAEQRGAQNDQLQMTKNNNLEVRIQHAFMKVRNGLTQNSLRYEWFKVRTTNGIDSF